MNSYYLDSYTELFIVLQKGNADVELDFYDFLGVSHDASKEQINMAYKSKQRILEHAIKYNYISKEEIVKESIALNRIESCLLYNDKNRQVYDRRIAETKGTNGKKKTYKIAKNETKAKIININNMDLKRKVIKIVIGATALVAFVSCSTTIVNESGKEMVETVVPYEEGVTNYSDADDVLKMETISYFAASDSEIYTIDDIAKELGVSTEECIQVGNLKANKYGRIFNVSVPEEIAKRYNEEKQKIKDHFICKYKTPDKFSSLINVAYDIIDEYPAFAEGNEYNKNGRTPANYLAACMIEDNPSMGDSFQNAKAGDYTINFYGTDEEYYKMLEEGKLRLEETKEMPSNLK